MVCLRGGAVVILGSDFEKGDSRIAPFPIGSAETRVRMSIFLWHAGHRNRLNVLSSSSSARLA